MRTVQEPLWTKLCLNDYAGYFIPDLFNKNKSRAISFKNMSLFIDKNAIYMILVSFLSHSMQYILMNYS